MSQPHNAVSSPLKPLSDRYRRTVDYVRLAVTSQCNLRCMYCMREEHTVYNPEGEALSGDEIVSMLAVLARMGVSKVRYTGGEPLLRQDIVRLVRDAKALEGIETVSLTTNGLLLDRYLDDLVAAGIDAINFSFDTFDPERYREITRRNLFDKVHSNLLRLLECDALLVKINVLLLRKVNIDEITTFVELTRDRPVTVRFMELMPFDDHQIWRTGKFMGADKILETLHACYPDLQPMQGDATEYFSFSLPGYKGKVSVIPAFTRNFCSKCTRLRITSAGKAINCLYSREGTDLLDALRSGGQDSLEQLLRKSVEAKPRDGREAGGSALRTSMSEIGG
ncbi:MAG: GTP 3',8-cyclase MoaA [Prosthecochloris sp.]|uniref:GTP 3',8-cyclase MoaA n=1 Tax=Prosthecochloris sp. TaxID=290513 RepID=UPI0013C955E2|nr:GTP 3',8-cyclase MoaA [Prosthecochloris sp.]NEX11226.1 GTP 3',8-cyclase MoaA [Prosthecochloris sp.]